jgi:glycogenin
MWYNLPEEKPKAQEPPKPIFPWEREEYHRPKPTRVFADDVVPPPLPDMHFVEPTPEEEVKAITAGFAPSSIAEELIFQPFVPQPNAWDNVESIERYVRAVMGAQTRRTTKQQQPQPQEILSPSERRESLILTDFPTADDRPSLPVTPAPIRRPTFWGEERDETGELPPAEGVPDQADWVCPRCGFQASSPVAFYRARRTSSSSNTAPWQRASQPTRSFELPPLPPHLRHHRESSSEASAVSATSTVVPPTTVPSTAAPLKFEYSTSPSAVPSAVASLRRSSIKEEEEQTEHVLLDPLLPDYAPTPVPASSPLQEESLDTLS